MLYLRPAQIFLLSPLHEDFIYDAAPSFFNKVKKKPTEKPYVNSLF